jgi:hypothetical protein
LALPRCPYMMSPIQQHMQEKQTRDGKSPKIQTSHTALCRENAGAIIPH